MLRVIFRPIPGGLPGMAVTDGNRTVVVMDPDVRFTWALHDLTDLSAECLNRLIASVTPPTTGQALKLVG